MAFAITPVTIDVSSRALVMIRRSDTGPRLWHEPLVHFLAIGALLFVVFHWGGGSRAGSSRIVITPGQIDAIVAGFTRTWQRPPTEEELKGQLDEHVREEIATREAMALGLDRDDTVIQRRLRQKLEFMTEDAIEATPPTDAELQAWLDAHPDRFRLETEVAFRQVYLSPDRRGPWRRIRLAGSAISSRGQGPVPHSNRWAIR